AAILTAVCVAAFGGGLLAGYVKNKPEKEEVVKAEENVEIEEETPTFRQTNSVEKPSEAEKKAEYYIIRADGGDIVVTEVYSDGTTEEAERTEFEYEMLRKDDRELLEEGIKAFTREEAMIRLEDFIS
ncbi:MAG: hypothetical protein LUG52_09000, partial [Clostridia bacterium]|nr:hypothetical protein [Clostridia bacterium]